MMIDCLVLMTVQCSVDLPHSPRPHWAQFYAPAKALDMEFWMVPTIIYAWPI